MQLDEAKQILKENGMICEFLGLSQKEKDEKLCKKVTEYLKTAAKNLKWELAEEPTCYKNKEGVFVIGVKIKAVNFKNGTAVSFDSGDSNGTSICVLYNPTNGVIADRYNKDNKKTIEKGANIESEITDLIRTILRQEVKEKQENDDRDAADRKAFKQEQADKYRKMQDRVDRESRAEAEGDYRHRLAQQAAGMFAR